MPNSKGSYDDAPKTARELEAENALLKQQLAEAKAHAAFVSHAVVHPISAAMYSLKGIERHWTKGQSNERYWAALRKDPLFYEEVSNSVHALHSAALVVQNGRFSTGSIQNGDINRKRLDFLSLVHDAEDIIKYSAMQRNIGFRSHISSDAPRFIFADGEMIFLALMNLFDNAVKYSDRSSFVAWKVNVFNSTLKFSIKNSGTWFEPHTVFSPRVERRNEMLNRRQGTGIGLPVTNSVLKAHGVEAGLQFEMSQKPENAKSSDIMFYFDLPLIKDESASSK
ncbi:MAG: ATP-binding protein [Pseudomonadota bacterium]